MRSEIFTRRTATVTMSAPEASCACAMTVCDGYLPVPTISLDLNVRPAMVKGVSAIATACLSCLPAADEVHDLNAVAVADERGGEGVALENHEIVLDGDAPRINLELLEQFVHRQRLVELEWLPVERDAQGRDGRIVP